MPVSYSKEMSEAPDLSQPAGGPWQLVRAYYLLGKSGVVAFLLYVSFVTAVVTSDSSASPGSFIVLLLTGWLSAAGAAVLNQYLEQDVDGLMQRTCERPLVAGQIKASRLVPKVAVGMILIAVVIAAVFSVWLALFLFTGAFVYVVVYTLWLKRRSTLNVIVGGLAGSSACLAGAAIEGYWWSPTSLLLALLLFFWTPPHFWSLAIVRDEDYRRAGIPMLPVVAGSRVAAFWGFVHTLLLVGVSLILVPAGHFGTFYQGIALFAGGVFLMTAIHLFLRPDPAAARLNFRVSLAYLAILFAGMLVDVRLV